MKRAPEFPLPFGVLQWKNRRSVPLELGSIPEHGIVQECSDSRLLGTGTGYCLTEQPLL